MNPSWIENILKKLKRTHIARQNIALSYRTSPLPKVIKKNLLIYCNLYIFLLIGQAFLGHFLNDEIFKIKAFRFQSEKAHKSNLNIHFTAALLKIYIIITFNNKFLFMYYY